MTVSGRHLPLSRRAVERAVETVLDGERRRRATISVAFVGPKRIRAMNAEWKGVDRPTDVLAFPLAAPDGATVGDVYICRDVVRRQARRLGVGLGRELLRVVVHGTLHALGYDHPEEGRTASAMWRKQERYLTCLG